MWAHQAIPPALPRQEQARAPLHDLHQKPEAGKEQRRDHEEQREDEDEHDHANPSVGKCDGIGGDDTGYGARGAECRDRR